MRFQFQTFYDLATSAKSVQVIQVKIGGSEMQARATHLFGAYKWFKLGPAKVKLIPAATLPVDPQGMSYASDDPQTVDPRDQLNPGLCRITNGEDVFTKMSDLSAEQQERMYRTSMLDPRWSKFMLQHGFVRRATPLLWSVAQLRQDAWPGSNTNFPLLRGANNGSVANPINSALAGVQSISPLSVDPDPAATAAHAMTYKQNISSDRALIQTGHRVLMQWLPTDMLEGFTSYSGKPEQYASGINVCPTVSLMTIVLPKAFKTLFYYRLYVTQSVYFSGPRQVSPQFVDSSGTTGVSVGFDNFLNGVAVQMKPNGVFPGTNINSYKDGDGA